MSVTRKEESYLPSQVQSLLLAQEEHKKVLNDHEKRLKDVVTKGEMLKVGIFLFTAFFSVGVFYGMGYKQPFAMKYLKIILCFKKR